MTPGRSWRLRLPLLVALRYLKSTRRDAFITFLSATAAGGLALGVAALILALSALSGFQQELRGEILARTAQIEVALPAGADARAVGAALAGDPAVVDVRRLVHGKGWLLDEGRAHAVDLVGFEGRLPASFPGAAEAGEGVYLGERLATAWGLGPGDTVEIASSRPALSPLGPQPRTRRLTVAGTFPTGRTEVEDRVALPLSAARSLLGGVEERLEVSAGGLDEALALASRLPRILPAGAEVLTWQDLNRALFFALRLEKSLVFVAVLLIVVVAALALVSDLNLIIASKQPELGMFGAMGAPPQALREIFLWLGALLASLGVAAGIVFGVGGAWLMDRFRLLRLPETVYFVDYVPFVVHKADFAVILLAALALALAGSHFAARRAAALGPVEALRR